MKKGLAYAAAGLWLVVLLQFIWKADGQPDKVMEAFHSTSVTENGCVLQFHGQYAKDTDGEEKERLFIQVAERLGIKDGYVLGWNESEGQETLVFEKEGRNGDTQMIWSVLSGDASVYDGTVEAVSIQIKLQETDQVLAWQKHLQEICEQTGFFGQTDFCLSGSYSGKMDLAARNQTAERILSDMGAGQITGRRTMEVYTLYSYTPEIAGSVFTNGREINLNLAIYYDEQTDQTILYVGSPILKNDF